MTVLYLHIRQKGGGHKVFHARQIKGGTVNIEVQPKVQPGFEGKIPTSTLSSVVQPHYHRESSFSQEQLPYIDLLNRLLVEIIREHLTNEIEKEFEFLKSLDNYNENWVGAYFLDSIHTAVTNIIGLLCSSYPEMMPVIKAFFLQEDNVGINGLLAAIFAGASAEFKSMSPMELEFSFIEQHPMENRLKEYEVMCSGMPVAFEIIQSISKVYEGSKDSNSILQKVKDTLQERILNDEYDNSFRKNVRTCIEGSDHSKR